MVIETVNVKTTNVVVLMGESGSGKNWIQDRLLKSRGQKGTDTFKKIITYTTRPKRKNEQDGLDYHFISESEFTEMINNGLFIEYAKYKDWFYGISQKSITNILDDKDSVYVIILTPKGFRKLSSFVKSEDIGCKLVPIYIKTNERQRLKKLIDRGDDVTEIFRRYLTELGQFDGVEDDGTIITASYLYDEDSFNEIIDCIYFYVHVIITTRQYVRDMTDEEKRGIYK